MKENGYKKTKSTVLFLICSMIFLGVQPNIPMANTFNSLSEEDILFGILDDRIYQEKNNNFSVIEKYKPSLKKNELIVREQVRSNIEDKISETPEIIKTRPFMKRNNSLKTDQKSLPIINTRDNKSIFSNQGKNNIVLEVPQSSELDLAIEKNNQSVPQLISINKDTFHYNNEDVVIVEEMANAVSSGDVDTLNQFVNRVLEINPTIELSKLQRDLQQYRYKEIKANQGIQISGFANISSQYTNSDANDSRFDNTTSSESGINLNKNLYSFGARESQIASSLVSAVQADIEIKEQKNTVVFDLAATFLEAIRQRELVKIEKYRLTEHEDFLTLVEKAKKTDQVLKSQVFLARTGLAQRKQALIEAKRQLKQIEYTLERYIDNDVNISDLNKPIIPIIVLPDEEEFIEDGLKKSPQIHALQKAMDVAQHDYEAEYNTQYGSVDLTASLTGDKIFNNSNDFTVSSDATVEYSVPLYTSGAKNMRLKQAKIEYERARVNLDFAKKELVEQLKLAYYVIDNADNIRRLAKEEEENAMRVLEAFRGEVQQGGRAFSDIIAQIDAVAAGRNRQISSDISKILAAYAIMRHQGDLLYYLTK